MATILMIFLRINCPNFIGAAIPNFRLVWRPPYMPYHFRRDWLHCELGVLVRSGGRVPQTESSSLLRCHAAASDRHTIIMHASAVITINSHISSHITLTSNLWPWKLFHQRSLTWRLLVPKTGKWRDKGERGYPGPTRGDDYLCQVSLIALH